MIVYLSFCSFFHMQSLYKLIFLLSTLCRAVASKFFNSRAETLVDHSFGYLNKENNLQFEKCANSCRSSHILCICLVHCIFFIAIIGCGIPISPTNGYVNYTTTTTNSIAEYYCKDKYTLIGSDTALCLPGGRWSGVVPWCRCE